MLTNDFNLVSRTKLHEVYGVPCYAHAIGFSVPILQLKKSRQPNVFMGIYYYLTPGNSGEKLFSLKGEDFKECVIDGCYKEDFTFCAQPVQVKGYRTIALFFDTYRDGRMDYSFAFLNKEGLWESTSPYKTVTLHRNVEEVVQSASPDAKREFHGYGLVPEKTIPLGLKHFKSTKIFALSDGENTSRILITKEVDRDYRIGGMVYFDLNQKTFAPACRATGKPKNIRLPLPHILPQFF
jgi:hypothetical protein